MAKCVWKDCSLNPLWHHTPVISHQTRPSLWKVPRPRDLGIQGATWESLVPWLSLALLYPRLGKETVRDLETLVATNWRSSSLWPAACVCFTPEVFPNSPEVSPTSGRRGSDHPWALTCSHSAKRLLLCVTMTQSGKPQWLCSETCFGEKTCKLLIAFKIFLELLANLWLFLCRWKPLPTFSSQVTLKGVRGHSVPISW